MPHLDIRIAVNVSQWDADRIPLAVEILQAVTRALFPSMTERRMDSPVVVTIREETAEQETKVNE